MPTLRFLSICLGLHTPSLMKRSGVRGDNKQQKPRLLNRNGKFQLI